MSIYATFLEELVKRYPETALARLSIERESELRMKYPAIPEHYLEFLREVGVGGVGDNFAIYSAPVEPEEIFGKEIGDAKLKGYLFVGDDFWGGMVGFDTSKEPWEFVTIDHGDVLPNDQNSPKTYLNFLQAYLLAPNA